ncbi:branched-chain amino acid ABC transporter permease [Pyrolobus fumarii]|uniref:branched-chain amino acid ABC transporter permease n=1 Tax=Pyrolobus fumarii TaxID=54252 RepID=UPI00064E54D0|nr:branched-chain amino acid ABC transporter permease [Pyrolobus fumarii]
MQLPGPTVWVNGILLGGVYALASIGLAVSWGTSRVINLAHGAFLILGSYIALQLHESLGIHPLLAVPIAAVLGFALGYLLYYLVLHRVAENDIMSLLATFGLSLVLYAVMLGVWGPDARTIMWASGSICLSLGGTMLIVMLSKLYAFLASLVAITVVYAVLKWSSVGRAMRALAQSFEAARIVGIDPRSIGAIAFGLALAVTMTSGVMVTAYTSFTPDSGGIWLMVSFAVVALAGLRNMPGLLAAGVILGVVASIAGFSLGLIYQDALPMILVAVAFALKPEGVLTKMRVRRV